MTISDFTGVVRRGYGAWGMMILVCAALSGCGGSGSGAGGSGAGRAAPAGQLAQQVAARSRPTDIRRYRHSVLLDFERPTDAVFVTPSTADTPAPALADGGLLLAGPTDVKLSSILSGRPFPGDWALLGGHLRSDRDLLVDLHYTIDGQTLLQKRQMLPRGKSTAVFLDLAPLAQHEPLSASQTALLSIRPQSPATLELEDLLLVDNHETFAADQAEWTIEQLGHSLIIDRPMKFRIALPIDSTQRPAWTPVEIGATRFIAEQNYPAKRWVIYADGRSFEDGKLKIVGSKSEFDPLYQQQHATPAQITIPEDHGQLLRQTKGDANNDGYNELLGAHQIEAHGPRLDITLAPQSQALVKPILEIHNLPQGKLITTIEGRLIESADRLDDGRVLLTLPHKILRPATLNIRVQ